MYKICKAHIKKCFYSKGDPNIALLQIEMTLLGPELPSPATLLFNHPIRGIMPIIRRPPVGVNNDEEHHEILENSQTKDDKNQGTPRNYVSFPKGSTVAVQCEDGGPWTYGTVEGKGDHNHHEQSYNICITKTGQLVNRDRKHIKPTQITAEQNLSDQPQKHTTDPLDDIFKQLEKTTMHKHYAHPKQWTIHK